MIVPKRHVLAITDLNQKELVDMQVMLRRIIPVLLKSYNAKGYNLAVNSGRIAGMVVPHLHIHFVPRNERDALQEDGIVVFYGKLYNSESRPSVDIGLTVKKLRKLFKYEPK